MITAFFERGSELEGAVCFARAWVAGEIYELERCLSGRIQGKRRGKNVADSPT